MAKKFYVIALSQAFLEDVIGIQKGTIISQHVERTNARDRTDKCNARNGVTSSRKPKFGFILSDSALEKGGVYPELADQWLADRYDSDALVVMKSVLDPLWQGGRPVEDETIGYWLEDLGLTLDELRTQYQDRAQAALDQAGANRISQAETTARIRAVKTSLQGERSQFTYTFPAVAGMQAGRAFYVAQVPFSALVQLFRFDEEDVVPAHLRAQRILNESRAEAIGDYLVDNRADYVLPAITASASAEMAFEPVAVAGAAGSIGLLHIPMEATLLINDGQHRRRGVELALKKVQALSKETVAVTIFYDQGLERSQQMFADINGKQVKPSSAINALYDKRNPFNSWVLSVIALLPDVSRRIDMENSSVAAKSYKLWSLIAFKKFLSLLTGVTEKNIGQIDPTSFGKINDFVCQFFLTCSQRIPHWREMVSGTIVAYDVRERFVIGHAVWLEALAIFARSALFVGHLVGNGKTEDGIIKPDLALWDRLQGLEKIDVRKESRMWENRCVVLGKMQKTSDGINGTVSRLLALANLQLPSHLRELETRLAA